MRLSAPHEGSSGEGRVLRQKIESVVLSQYPVMLTAAQMAEVLGKSKKAVYTMKERGHLPEPVRVGVRGVLWRRDEVVDWLSEKSGTPSLTGGRR